MIEERIKKIEELRNKGEKKGLFGGLFGSKPTNE